jgi:ribose/xylose/arabinose/galactoside ABC-type transport system permease subunit
MADVRRIFIKLWRSYSIAPVVLLVGIVLSLLTPRFLQVGNLLNVLTNASVVAIVGLGMTLAIAGGMFDLSVASTAAFAGCIAFNLIPTFGVGVGVLGGLIVGAIIGGLNGLIITELRVPAFIATLGMAGVVKGATLIYTNGRDLYLYGRPEVKILSAGYMPLMLALGTGVLLALVISHARFGRRILAVGSNLASARRSGVRVEQVIWGIFAIVGATAALSGMIISAQVLTANARLGAGLELSAISVVVIGGTALTGGRASLLGTLLGSLLVAMINNGLNLLNVPIFYQNLTVGVLLLGALAIGVERGSNPLLMLRRQV